MVLSQPGWSGSFIMPFQQYLKILEALWSWWNIIYTLQVIPYYMKSMDFGAEIDGSEDFFQMFWPVTVSHKITEDSELYDISSRDISCRLETWCKMFQIVPTIILHLQETIWNNCYIRRNNSRNGKYCSGRVKSYSVPNQSSFVFVGEDFLSPKRDFVGLQVWELAGNLR